MDGHVDYLKFAFKSDWGEVSDFFHYLNGLWSEYTPQEGDKPSGRRFFSRTLKETGEEWAYWEGWGTGSDMLAQKLQVHDWRRLTRIDWRHECIAEDVPAPLQVLECFWEYASNTVLTYMHTPKERKARRDGRDRGGSDFVSSGTGDSDDRLTNYTMKNAHQAIEAQFRHDKVEFLVGMGYRQWENREPEHTYSFYNVMEAILTTAADDLCQERIGLSLDQLRGLVAIPAQAQIWLPPVLTVPEVMAIWDRWDKETRLELLDTIAGQAIQGMPLHYAKVVQGPGFWYVDKGADAVFVVANEREAERAALFLDGLEGAFRAEDMSSQEYEEHVQNLVSTLTPMALPRSLSRDVIEALEAIGNKFDIRPIGSITPTDTA